MKYRKILIGMSRPTRREVEEMLELRGVTRSYYWCRCLDPMIHSEHGSYESHYLAGHYDEPFYKYVWEDGGVIKESLSPPE